MLWYYATFSDTGGPADAGAEGDDGELLRRHVVRRRREGDRRGRRAATRRRAQGQGGRRRQGLRRSSRRPRPRLRRRRRSVERREVSRRLCIGLLLAALALAGCGGEGPTADDGTARLWVTRDRGASVLLDVEVPAGQTLLRALKSEAKVETRYGGGFVQSIDGLEGSARRHEDWFWFVNGLAGDRSAALVPAARRRHRLVGLPRLVARCRHPGGGRRGVPRAVPARVRRQGATRGRALRAGPRAPRRRASPGVIGTDDVAPAARLSPRTRTSSSSSQGRRI